MQNKDEPLITSWLDNDFYDYTQGDMIFGNCRDVPVELEFINRDPSIRLAKIIDQGELREQLQSYQTLGYRPGEIHYLGGIYSQTWDRKPRFRPDYLRFLSELKRLPEFSLEVVDGQFRLHFKGPASEVIYWEIPSMMIVKRLYLKALMKNYSQFQRRVVEADSITRLADKLQLLKEDPAITFADFGTRRSYSSEHQSYCVGVLKEELPDQFRGTSNVLLAKEHEVMPIGTNSHKLQMIHMGTCWEWDNLDPTFSQRSVLLSWERRYGLDFSIFLSDTWNSRWYFKNVVTDKQLGCWNGARQDSGDPIVYAEDRISDYRRIGVNPLDKIIVFADDITPKKMLRISRELKRKIGCMFGWGTDLTCDIKVPHSSIPIVTKVSRCNGHHIAKLSDTPGKASGSPEAIERVRKLINLPSKT